MDGQTDGLKVMSPIMPWLPRCMSCSTSEEHAGETVPTPVFLTLGNQLNNSVICCPLLTVKSKLVAHA